MRELQVWVAMRGSRCPVEIARALVRCDPRLGLRGVPQVARGFDPERNRDYGYVYARVRDREGDEPFEIRAYLGGVSLRFPRGWEGGFARVRRIIVRLELFLGPNAGVRVNGLRIAR